ncbi:TetR/AcrR family transcriptional regulator [Streptomyces sp. SPB074]|uniref:TetR/AcrR family transcriptional regulator n=1 Tax=Streptomyces sp. (strain SPB074) TaxID=465543 RepID=UPI00017F122A|nr:TetR/AcrR family transcriptional regulator [Streptomyces sp. SPB074]EDY43628.1 TetR-family transcriptional regulator [Streptomyces sp. SPB074]
MDGDESTDPAPSGPPARAPSGPPARASARRAAPPRATPPRSRRERPAKPALSRSGIVAAAIRVMAAEGLDKVTMRRLARELDTGPASLYVYVAGTTELHAAILDELLGEVRVPASAGVPPEEDPGDWEQRLIGLLASYTLLLFRYPGLARSALVARPSGPRYLDLVEHMLALLAEGGVAPDRAAWGVDLLLQHATATAAEQTGHDSSPVAEEEWQAVRHAVHGADPGRHPHIRAASSLLLSGTPDARFTWAFRALLQGISHTPVPHEGPSQG